MASFELFGKRLEIPQRNEALVNRLRELLAQAEDGEVVSMSMVCMDTRGEWDMAIIEGGNLNFAALGALDLLHARYRDALMYDDDDDDGDDES